MNAPGQVGQDFWPFAFLILFPLFWCGACALLSIIGGWHELAKSYLDDQNTFKVAVDMGNRFGWASMSLGPRFFPTSYSNCLTIRVSSEGIRLNVWPMFRFLHPPLLIPWQDIVNCEREQMFFLYHPASVYLRDHPHPLRFFGRAGKEILNVWSQRNRSG